MSRKMDLLVLKKCSSSHRLVILLPISSYYNCATGVIVSVLCSFVLSKNNKLAIHARPHETRAATRLTVHTHLSALHEMTKVSRRKCKFEVLK